MLYVEFEIWEMSTCEKITLKGSFSAVSRPIFESKFSFCRISEIYKICALLHRCNLTKIAKIAICSTPK